MPGGTVIGALFFIMVFFAAITSSISLMETVVSIVCDKTGLKRIPASLTVLGVALLLGAASALGYSAWSDFTILNFQILDFFDFISNNIIMPLVALLTCIFVAYFLKPKTLIKELENGGEFKSKTLFTVMVKYVAPVFIIAILISSILNVFGVITI
jgi:NSS family neurotransmitter:Na+ symporter